MTWRAHPIWEGLEGMERGTLTTADGVALSYQSFGEGYPILLANGIGVRHPGLVMQIAHLRRRFRVITWDYRGLGDSRLPHSETDLSIGTHATDVLALMDELSIDEAALGGWSMGVQVGLEVIRRRPGAISAFIAMFGTYGKPFETALPGPVARLIERSFGASAADPRFSRQLLKLGDRFPALSVRLLRTIRFIGPDTFQPVYRSDMNGIAVLEHEPYFRTMLELCRHDAFDVLPQVPCPTLIVAGTRDYLTPPRVARAMAEEIPDATCVVFDGGSHFGVIEPRYEINAHIDQLLARALP